MRIVAVFILMTFFLQALAQQDSVSNGVSFGLRYFGGQIYVHTNKIYLDAPRYSSGVEFSYQKQTTGTKDWHQRFGFPEVSVNGFYSNNGSKALGYAVAIYPAIQFKVVSTVRSQIFFKVGGGLGMSSKRWQRIPASDSLNNFVGSRLNNFSMFQLGWRQDVHQHITLQAGLHFYHLSNAAARSPNFGINTLGVHLGINYHLQKVVHHFPKRVLQKQPNPLNIGLAGIFGMAEDKAPNGPIYPIATGSISLQQMYRKKSRVIFGADATRNNRSYALIRNTFQYNANGRYITPWQITAFLGHEFLFGKIGLPVMAGVYLTRPLGGPRIYQKLGLNYHFFESRSQFIKDTYLTLLLKTHFAQAQHAELGIGFLF
jgi:hypothetical protein